MTLSIQIAIKYFFHLFNCQKIKYWYFKRLRNTDWVCKHGIKIFGKCKHQVKMIDFFEKKNPLALPRLVLISVIKRRIRDRRCSFYSYYCA